jgi:hypothetical protein
VTVMDMSCAVTTIRLPHAELRVIRTESSTGPPPRGAMA